MATSSVLTGLVVGIGLAVTLAAGCGGKEESDRGGVVYDNEGGSTGRARDAYVPDTSCSPAGSLRDCLGDIEVNGVHSCFPGLAVCQGEGGWTVCMDTAEATELAATIKATLPDTGTAGASADSDSAAAGATN